VEVTNHQLRFNKYSFKKFWKCGLQAEVIKKKRLSSSEMGFHFPNAYPGDSGHPRGVETLAILLLVL